MTADVLADLIEAQTEHLRHGGPAPDLTVLPESEREHAAECLRLVALLTGLGPPLPPLEEDPVAIRLGLVGPDARRMLFSRPSERTERENP